jgi:hypothetical protein
MMKKVVIFAILILDCSKIFVCPSTEDRCGHLMRSTTESTIAQETKPISKKTEDIFMNMIRWPTTPMEFLKNCKIALENDLLLKEDFFR